jgi:hypothetical protein
MQMGSRFEAGSHPDIFESIAEGRQPRSLTLQRLLAPVLFAWADQRRQFV